jgi:hypothetical protein
MGQRDSSTMDIRNASFGAGCGAVSALLFAVISTSSPLAFPLYLVAPLPILIATLGFTQSAGLVATLTAFAVTSLLFSPLIGLIHAASISLPAWFIGYLALLARPSADPSTPDAIEWYPTGRLLFWTITLSAGLTVAGVLMLGNDYAAFVASFETMLNELIAFEPALFSGLMGADAAGSVAAIAHFLAIVAAPISAAISAVISVALLYAAGRIVKASGLLPRPWPDLATTHLPKLALPLLMATLVLTLIGSDFIGLFGRIGLAALLVGFCLQGLAVLHYLTRPIKSRRMILVMIYSIFLFLPGWPILGFAALGVADFWLHFRTRFTASSPSTL